MSYNFLNSFTNRLAAAIMKEIGGTAVANQDGDFVIAVCMTPSDHLVATLLAIWKAGAAYLPLDVTFPLNRIDHIVKEAKPVLVIHDDDCEFHSSQPPRRGTSALGPGWRVQVHWQTAAGGALLLTPVFIMTL